jgi:hydrogenase maturation protease
MNRPIRVIGVGSPHGDDAVGLVAVRLLRAAASDGSIEFHAVDSGQRLLDFLDGQGSLILIDALRRESAIAGTIQRLTWPDERIEALHPGSTHALGVPQALQLAEALGQLPKQMVIFAIEIGASVPGEQLSPAVAAALPELVNRVRAEIAVDIRMMSLAQGSAIRP